MNLQANVAQFLVEFVQRIVNHASNIALSERCWSLCGICRQRFSFNPPLILSTIRKVAGQIEAFNVLGTICQIRSTKNDVELRLAFSLLGLWSLALCSLCPALAAFNCVDASFFRDFTREKSPAKHPRACLSVENESAMMDILEQADGRDVQAFAEPGGAGAMSVCGKGDHSPNSTAF